MRIAFKEIPRLMKSRNRQRGDANEDDSKLAESSLSAEAKMVSLPRVIQKAGRKNGRLKSSVEFKMGKSGKTRGCGACGEPGHNRRNKRCRLFGKTGEVDDAKSIASHNQEHGHHHQLNHHFSDKRSGEII
mmetsp:Transcript_30927/g.75421  ORF Transcript_30927/g.75421 Transcript_30927/m.75421 type:complete len:131 (-) Transcript_30927:234-626(-)